MNEDVKKRQPTGRQASRTRRPNRRPWSTPRVIVSDARTLKTHPLFSTTARSQSAEALILQPEHLSSSALKRAVAVGPCPIARRALGGPGPASR